MSDEIQFLSDRRVLEIKGPDTASFLQRVITCDTERFEPGEIRPGALLTPQGKIVSDFLLYRTRNGVYLDIWYEAAEMLLKRLSLYRLRADAGIRLADELAVFIGRGSSDPRSGNLPKREISPSDPAHSDGTDQQSHNEIKNGIPSLGRDYHEAEVFPTDVNLDFYGGIAWKKGCFIGQEVLSRMKRRGTIRKRSIGVRSETALDKGDELFAGEKPIGSITSADDKYGVAIVRLDRLEGVEDGVQTKSGPVRLSLPKID